MFGSINYETNKQLRRGEIYYADLSSGAIGSEQSGIRPVLIVQNDIGNKFSKTTLIAPITSQTSKSKLPTHVKIMKNESGLLNDSIVLMEQVRIIDKIRLKQKIGILDESSMQKIDRALCVSFGLAIPQIIASVAC